ncbi:MAG: SDR family NAD(P)-dependent oxidoreductase [Burkholderiales bacterium]|nr:SDR family NAD(P)-dependent oxidoreductase [Burkholderiales bacterium]
MSSAFQFKDRSALVTGAGSGIGRATALALAGHGCHLALADLNAANLGRVADECAALGVRVSRHTLDVADRAAVAALPVAVQAEHGALHLLVNNAGVAAGGTFEQISEADFEWLFNINFWGVVRMTRAFLPLLKAAPEARIVNVSSVYGLISPPGQAAYSSSKFAVRGFSQALRHELAGSSVGVTVVHPGGVATEIARSARVPAGADPADIAARRARADRMLRLPPARAAEIILRAVQRRQGRVLVGGDAKLLGLIERLMPVNHWRLISKLLPPQ